MDYTSLTLKPIGFIHSPWKDRGRAPRQPGVGPVKAEGIITLNPGSNFEAALADLDGFEMIWLVFWFHMNKGWRPKVLPPRSRSRIKRGVFATRSPHRPNPIGLSSAKLLEVSGRTLRVADVDLLDGTPILDIKPYLPYADSFPNAKIGWLEHVHAAESDTSGAHVLHTVKWSDLARNQVTWLAKKQNVELKELAEQALERDPQPHPYRRITALDHELMQLAIKSWRMVFSVSGTVVTIEEIRSGYAADVVKAATLYKPLHDHNAQKAFHKRWPQKTSPAD
jgi:tRNA (adenine37-N6)-methyltransferase